MLVENHRFHGDEALYAFWSMDMAKHTNLILGTPYLLYKPQIYLFFAALTYPLFTVSEIFAQIPNIVSGILSIFISFTK